MGLADHLRSVGDRADAHAQRLGLPVTVIRSVALAGRFHDLGKAEVRFQTMLRHGRRFAAESSADDATLALAKSTPVPFGLRRQIARRSGWPSGMRHEAISLAMVIGAPEQLFEGTDRDLVAHLVASHHGHARPFFPPLTDNTPTDVQVIFEGVQFTASTAAVHPALDHAVQFARLCDQYGTWGLALLEAIVRLADMSVSEEGS